MECADSYIEMHIVYIPRYILSNNNSKVTRQTASKSAVIPVPVIIMVIYSSCFSPAGGRTVLRTPVSRYCTSST